jgi:hypothetical protein
MAEIHTSSADAPATGLEQQLQQAREEAELTLEQLHLVQEELEHYFLAHQDAETQLQRYRQEQQRAETLIEALLARLEARGA